MTVTTGLSGNEIYCLEQKGFLPGNIVVGNSVQALGFVGSIGSGFKAILGGEIDQITSLIREGRESAYHRMLVEAKANGASGITGVTSELIFHGSRIEFLSIGSAIHDRNKTNSARLFSTSADGQELYAQLDVGYEPIGFCFGNSVYSLGIRQGLIGGIKTFKRGEIKEYSDLFNRTRHLALRRIMQQGNYLKADAVLGIQTSIIPISGVVEMIMIGTAARQTQTLEEKDSAIVTSDMTNVEMWNMVSRGYTPMRLVLGTSVYSLGFVGGMSSLFKSFVRGEISELTHLIYAAREQAIGLINDEAKAIGADDVVGVKTYVYQLGNGLIEFLAIGTAVKKAPGIHVLSEQLPPQAIIADKNTFYDSNYVNDKKINLNAGSKPIKGPYIITLIVVCILLKLTSYFFFGR
jgi:uncharacterized protein YbjQ (UPF0145 family)